MVRHVHAGARSIIPDSIPATYSVSFGRFRLVPAQQLLLEDENPVALGARAMQILIALVERAGEVVSKDALASRVWPETFVEESNLRVNIANLRRAIRDGQGGNRFIVNVPGRGYSFVAPVAAIKAPTSAILDISGHLDSLPPVATRIIGRDDILSSLAATLSDRRLVTIVGPGGIGKTTVALAMARELAPSYRDGVAFADLGSVASGQLAPTMLSAVFGLAVPSDDALPALVAFLRNREMLLVLDNCEHVVEVAAEMAERISVGAPGVHVIATSREPLRAAGERVLWLPPLESPPSSTGLGAGEALRFPGVQLLVERAAASLGAFELSDADAPFAADICRRLDGIALAIEFAAGRIAAFGLRELAAKLDDRFDLLTSGRRTALPRHQTLAATLDWSYELLSAAGRRMLRQLSVFVGGFTGEAASAMFDPTGEEHAAAELAELVAKSMVVADTAAQPVRYRLLDTTRLYGLEKLRRAQGLEPARRRHAEYFCRRFATAEADTEALPAREWLSSYGKEIDNVRLALDWAEAAEDGAELQIELAAEAVPLWVQFSMTGECRRRVAGALARLDAADDTGRWKRHRMRLSAALGWSLMYGAGRSDEVGTAWQATMCLAEELGDGSYRLRALWGVWISQINQGNWTAGIDLARQLIEAGKQSGDAPDRMTADRLFATTMHYIGDQGTAQQYIERMLTEYGRTAGVPRVAVRFQVDQKITARYFHARILWLLGHFDRAMDAVDRNMREGLAAGHALSFASVLGQGACPIALYTGDLPAARRFGKMLMEHAERYQLGLWYDWACCFEGAVLAQEGDLEAGLRAMRLVLDRVDDGKALPRYMILFGELAAGLGAAASVTAGLEIIDSLIARCDRTGELWFVPEAMRIKGGLIVAGGRPDAERTAETLLLQADKLARQQHARAWRLRIGVTLAQLRRDGGRTEEATAALGRVVRSFNSGMDTADLRAARKLLII
jgi:predicted ATPase/DNA-binding winged helix-turn-helix (wHTH) protein